jgi:hypothetical protein
MTEGETSLSGTESVASSAMMMSRTRVAILAAAALISALLVPVFAQAKPAKITGKLSARDYTVIALSARGTAKTDRAPHRTFKLRPPAKKVTLQLRAPDGTYAGPIVVAKARHGNKVIVDKVIVGVRAGARLGRVKVKPGDGYAKPAKWLPGKYVNSSRVARAEDKTPLGAGNLGLIPAATSGDAPGDGDLDGIPDALDVDDDGDVVLDRFDPQSGTATARTSADTGDVVVRGISLLDLDLPDVVNANAPGLTEAQIEAALPRFGGLLLGSLGIEASGPDDPAVELDCGDPDTGLIYCRRNGSTGRITSVSRVPHPPGAGPGDPFPGCCDPDEDGFGSLGWAVIPGDAVDAHAVPLLHGATSDQIGADDLLIARTTGADGNEAFTGTLAYLFETVPALASYADEAGNTTTMSYPVTPGASGTQENPFVPTDGPDADTDVEVTLTFWRAQRRALPEEPGEWIDVGHTVYITDGRSPFENPSWFEGSSCPPSAYSETDPNLSPAQAPAFPLFYEPAVSGLQDSSDDQPADPANTFTFTLNLNRCFGTVPVEQHLTGGLFLRAQPVNPLPGPPDNARATVAWFKPG